MPHPHPGFRIFVLGAGFSRPAGLPLATELFSEVRGRIESRYGTNTKFQRDIENYIEYRTACDGITLTEKDIDLEEFMSFLDIEHFLWLRGKDTWSDEGNESQLMIRKGIGEVIHEKTPPAERLPDFYYRFAERLSTRDTVITLNYDILLERALEHIGKPYRLFPNRYKEIHQHSNIIDSDVEEVVILKLHGSIDWFDDQYFLERKVSLEKQGLRPPRHIHKVFDDPRRYDAKPIVDGLRSPNDPLLHIHRIRDVAGYYQQHDGLDAPLILSPSHVKFVYAQPLVSFWEGMGRSGGYNLGISIIGFSLPKHDEYIRIGLYQMISNYQQSWWDEKMLGTLKDNVRAVDLRSTSSDIAEYKMRYNFLDPTRTEYLFSGFGNDAVEFLFDHSRK